MPRSGPCKNTGRDELVALQEMVAALSMRLVLVGDEQLGCVEVAHVGDERPAAVGGGVVGDEVLAHAEAQSVADRGDAPVAGVLTRTPRDSWRWRTSVTSSIS